MKTLKVKIKNIYGNEMIYPACEDSKVFANLTNSKTLTEQARRLIKSLGYKFEIVPEVKSI